MSFTFDATKAQAIPSAVSTTTALSTFSFGTPGAGDAGKTLQQGATPTFGQDPNKSKGLFGTGLTGTIPQSTGTGFGFGATATTSTPTIATGFGGATATQPTGLTFGTNTFNTGLSFGSISTSALGSTPNFGLSSATATTTTPTTGLTFGGAKPATTTGFSLGAGEAPAPTATTGLTFGTPSTIAATTGFGLGIMPTATTTSSATTTATGFNLGNPIATTSASGISLDSSKRAAGQPGVSLAPTATTSDSGFGISTSSTTAPAGLALGTLATTSATPGFSYGVSATVPTLGSTATPGSLTTPSTQLSLGTTTTVSSSASSTQPMAINFFQLEESINKWTLQLEEQEKVFVNHAAQINAWDKLLITNGEKIVALNQEVERVKIEQQQLEHELDYVVGQQKELQDCLVPLEKELASLSVSDPEREYTYRLAENLDTQLKQMSEDLKEIIEHLNEANRTQDSSDPIVQIGKILNAHMNSLQWLDQQTALLTQKIQQIEQMHQNFRQENERSFNLAYN